MTGAYQTQTLSHLATEIPGATAVFRKYKLDFCCGGAVSLAEAASAKGLDAASIAAELAAIAPSNDEAPRETGALIAHILTRFHDVHRRELPELIRLAKRVEAVHGARPDAPNGLAEKLQRLTDELDAHMQKEEQVLFPMMQAGGNPFIHHPIAVMRAEHIEAGDQLKAIEPFAIPAPEGACPTWRALNAGLIKFADDLMTHIHLENNILFPAFETHTH
ncbi:regulator of cell morphogenesis and NO signaling [Rhizomicrobium palustre]|uniref:Regulator of cell morphogenesis and NO signaling n=1 Tax=Rhizomicrobium palustre TaxID=189966 RepID=A0A846N032_9PROT|nr:iron-sulfur cluster repair protein YtfE [Rhizomicrobium palustre]NIK89046.1 regulator of cell morphogenesis and NO signaling [Rhizomicrobium palustre]